MTYIFHARRVIQAAEHLLKQARADRWPLPAYELACILARNARDRGDDSEEAFQRLVERYCVVVELGSEENAERYRRAMKVGKHCIWPCAVFIPLDDETGFGPAELRAGIPDETTDDTIPF